MGKRLLSLGLIFAVAVGCQTSPVRRDQITVRTNLPACGSILDGADWSDEVKLLGVTGELYHAGCYRETLELGGLLREKLRDKDYSVTAETLSILGPEQMTQTYVLESHERVYMTLLLALAHLKLGATEAAQVELRRADQEQEATLYNHGRDEVSNLLLASLWEELGQSDNAAPYWRRLGVPDFGRVPAALAPSPLRVYSVGELGAYDWRIGGDGLYRIEPKNQLPDRCVSATGVLIPVKDWADKMSLRHSHDYHPLLNFKTYVRLPIALGYGLALGGTGVTVAVGGCMLAASGGGNGSSDACKGAIEAGGWIASKAPGVMEYVAQPDLRHLPQTPAAFLVTRAPALGQEQCAPAQLPHMLLR